MHMIDVERVMCYRALVASRGDNKTILYGMDDHLYVLNAIVAGRLFNDLDTLLDRPADCCYATVADMALHAKRGMALHSLAKDVQPSLMSAKLSSLLGYRCDYTLLDPLTKSN